jgi:hypothetical protein
VPKCGGSVRPADRGARRTTRLGGEHEDAHEIPHLTGGCCPVRGCRPSVRFIGRHCTTNQGNSIPFSFPGTSNYQQVYASGSFSGPIQINQIDFFNTENVTPGQGLDTGTFTFTLSYASSPSLNLSTNLASNIGADSTTVFSGSLPSIVGGELTFSLATPFSYDPTLGNLLLTVTGNNLINPVTPTYLDAATANGLFSRAYDINGVFSANDGVGLVTEFDGTPVNTPLPAALPLFATGLGGLGLLGWRRKRKVQPV